MLCNVHTLYRIQSFYMKGQDRIPLRREKTHITRWQQTDDMVEPTERERPDSETKADDNKRGFMRRIASGATTQATVCNSKLR